MRLHAALLCLPLFFALPAHAQQGHALTPVEALRRSRPSAKWNAASAKIADVDCDSKLDTVVLGSENEQVVIGVVWGSHKQPQVFVFPINSGAQDGFCAAPKKIEISVLNCDSGEGTLPGCKLATGCKEFSVSDEKCDSFHFYWDASQKKLTWWRL